MTQPTQPHPDPLQRHRQLQGKIETRAKADFTPENLATFYTPGVGKVSSHLAEHPEDAPELTLSGNSLPSETTASELPLRVSSGASSGCSARCDETLPAP